MSQILRDQYQKLTEGTGITYMDAVLTDTDDTFTICVVGINGDGAAGDIVIEQADGSEFTFSAAQPGASFNVSANKVKLASTATGIFVGVMS